MNPLACTTKEVQQRCFSYAPETLTSTGISNSSSIETQECLF